MSFEAQKLKKCETFGAKNLKNHQKMRQNYKKNKLYNWN